MADIAEKTYATLEWAKTWSELDGYLKLNAIITSDGDATLDTTVNDREIIAYIDGTAKREFTFQLRIVTPWSDGNDPTNMEAMRLAGQWLDWVSKQYAEGNLPDFGTEILAIESVKNVPALNAVYENDNLAEYLIQARILYIE